MAASNQLRQAELSRLKKTTATGSVPFRPGALPNKSPRFVHPAPYASDPSIRVVLAFRVSVGLRVRVSGLRGGGGGEGAFRSWLL